MANHRKTKEEFDKQISEKYNENLESINFQTTKHPVTIRCKDCGYEQFFSKAANFIYCAPSERKGFCPNCRKEKVFNKMTHSDFLKRVEENNSNSFEFLTEYKNRDKDITARCLKCNSIFTRNARAFLLDRDCPCCGFRKSHGENKIMKILKSLNIPYQNNYVLENFDKRKSFDIKIEINNKLLLIEYDGIQHFEYNSFLHKNDINNFYLQQKNDELKNQFCKNNNIPLLRISYKQEITEELILNFINTNIK